MIEDLAKKCRHLSDHQKALLIERLALSGVSPLQIPLFPFSVTQELSFGQERLWFLSQLDPLSSSYLLNRCVRITGPLSVQALQRSIDLVVERYDILKTGFAKIQGNATRVYVKDAKIFLETQSIGPLSEDQLKSYLVKEANHPFDLSSPPLFRIKLYSLKNGDHILLLVAHHILVDGLSLDLLIRDVAAGYKRVVNGEKIEISKPLIQYSDYVCWQREWFQGPMLHPSLAFWREYTENAENNAIFPCNFTQSDRKNTPADLYEIKFQGPLYKQIQEHLKEAQTTPFNCFLALLVILLYQHTGFTETLIGTPVSGRLRPELQEMVGLLINTIVIRTSLDSGESFRQFLKRVSAQSVRAFEHQIVPFEQIARENNYPRSALASSLFQILFIYQKSRHEQLELEDLSWEVIPIKPISAKHPLTFEVIETSSCYTMNIEYDTSLYSSSAIRRIAQHVQALVGVVLENPDLPIHQLLLASGIGEEQFHVWCPTKQQIPEKTIHELILETCDRYPHHTAIVYEHEMLTYEELQKQVDCYANFLLKEGVLPGDKIGVCMRPGISLIPSLLGIFKAGCSYVPLDPTSPLKRIDEILIETEIKIVITEGRDLKIRSSLAEVRFLPLPTKEYRVGHYPKPETQATALAYIMYTSGSSGGQKGVMVEHRSVVNALIAFQQILEVGQKDRWLSATTFSFDISVLEFFLPLISGASLCLVARTDFLNLDTLLAAVDHYQPTIIQGTPSFWQLLCAKQWKAKWPIQILCGGESLPPSLAKYLAELTPHLFNVYGPTETTIWSTHHRVRPQEEQLYIGTPISNTQVYILDDSLNPVPINAVGELYIGGIGVSRGYLNQPELTEQRFIKLEHLGIEGLVFATRDKVRISENGFIQYLGRSDFQLKIRGMRIEPQEIETALETHPSVQRSLVCAQRDPMDSSHTLIAFIQPTDLQACRSSDLYHYLKDKLPHFMIPSHWRILDQFPLLPNGKIDRNTLSHLDLEEADEISSQDTPPTNKVESLLHEIWASNLRRQRIGVHNNYFELGGHSLLALQLVDTISRTFGKELSLKHLFQHSTISALAQFLEKEAELLPRAFHPFPPVVSNPSSLLLPFPLTDMQRAYLTGQMNLFGQSKTSSHLYREFKVGTIDLTNLENALNFLVQRHPAMRTIILPNAQQQVLKEVPHYFIKVVEFHNEQVSSKALDQTREEMAHQILTGTQWPLFELRVSRFSDCDHLHISINLLIADAASLHIILRELSALYVDPSLTLPPQGITFRDYIQHLHSPSFAPHYEKSKAYWLSRLESFPPGPALPIKSPLTQLTNIRFKRHQFRLTRREWDALKYLGQKEGISPNALLIAAFASILKMWSSQSQFSIVLTLFNRLHIHEDVPSIVGDFTTLSLFEVLSTTNDSFSDLAKRCQAQLLSDLDHRFYSGVLFTQEMLKKGKIEEPISVVFTSLIGYPSENFALTADIQHSSDLPLGLTQTPQVSLDHQVVEQEGSLYLNWDVVEEIFPPQLISLMFNSYVAFLHQLSLAPHRWKQIPILTVTDLAKTREQEEIVKKRGESTVWQSKENLLFEGIITQAKIAPDRTAIIQEGHRISYRALVERAYRIRAELESYSLPSRSVIGILMRKGWEYISTSVAIMLQGNAFIPLDPDLPIDRLKEVIRESGCSLLCVEEEWDDFAGVCQFVHRECLMKKAPPDCTWGAVKPHFLAYVIYTSGSTGKPKGVMIDHQAAMNTIHSVNRHLNVSSADVVYGISSFSFDLSIYDIFGVLTAGGTLVLPESSSIYTSDQWIKDIRTYRVTLWNSVPYFVSMLVNHLQYCASGEAQVPALRAILMSGDNIPPRLPSKIYSLLPEVHLISLGGATEASIWSIWYDIPKDRYFDRSIPYGISMDNQPVFVLDSALQECPVWAEGEIFIGGVGVAQGYWNNPDMTAKHFLSHPQFGRLFRTYDKGRYSPDGMIEFLGRVDQQVKIRGFRIELSEIEAKICSYPGVKHATVITVNDREEEKEVCAFVSLEDNVPKEQEPLLSFLGQKLPHYMVPNSIFFLSSMPITSNRKIDYNSLRLLYQNRTTTHPIEASNTSSLHDRISEIWQQILQIPHIPDTRTSFFDLGGDSFKLIKLHAELSLLVKHEITIADLFRSSTIEGQFSLLSKRVNNKNLFNQSKHRAHLREQLGKG